MRQSAFFREPPGCFRPSKASQGQHGVQELSQPGFTSVCAGEQKQARQHKQVITEYLQHLGLSRPGQARLQQAAAVVLLGLQLASPATCTCLLRWPFDFPSATLSCFRAASHVGCHWAWKVWSAVLNLTCTTRTRGSGGSVSLSSCRLHLQRCQLL